MFSCAAALSAVGVACFVYLVLAEGVQSSYLPSPLHPHHLLHTSLTHTLTLLHRYVHVYCCTLSHLSGMLSVQAKEALHLERLGRSSAHSLWRVLQSCALCCDTGTAGVRPLLRVTLFSSCTHSDQRPLPQDCPGQLSLVTVCVS